MKYEKSAANVSKLFAILICILCSAPFVSGEQLAVGNRFPELKGMQDQHEVAYEMPDDLEHVAVAFTMSVGKSAKRPLPNKVRNTYPIRKRFLSPTFMECLR